MLNVWTHAVGGSSSAPQLAIPPSVSDVSPSDIVFPSPSFIVQEISLGQLPTLVHSSSMVSPVAASKVSVPSAPVMVAPVTTVVPLTRIFTAAPFHPSPNESAMLNVCVHCP